MEYPILDKMTDLELILLHNEVADSKDPTDIEFRCAILDKLKDKPMAYMEFDIDLISNGERTG